ncbi:MAG: PASTA domain-containing protein [Ruthenibacterium sp.]
MGNKRIAKKKQGAANVQETLSARKIGALKAAGKEVPPPEKPEQAVSKQGAISAAKLPEKPPKSTEKINEKQLAENAPTALSYPSETKIDKAPTKNKSQKTIKKGTTPPVQKPTTKPEKLAQTGAQSEDAGKTDDALTQTSAAAQEKALPKTKKKPAKKPAKPAQTKTETSPEKQAAPKEETEKETQPILTTTETDESAADKIEPEMSQETVSDLESNPLEAEEKSAETVQELSHKKRHYKLPIFAGLTTVIALGSVLFIFLLFTISGSALLENKADVDLPSFIGLSQKDVEANAEFDNFNIEFVNAFAEDVKAGEIFSQTPKPPKQVKENAHIMLRVSMGKHQVIVPDVNGRSREAAEKELRKNELSILTKVLEDDSIPEETVLRTEPVSGTSLEAGSTVTLYIARSMRETGTVVPSIVGLSKTKAEALLRSRGLAMGSVSKVASDSPVGTVLSQKPKAKTGAQRGASVSVSISSGGAAGTPGAPAALGTPGATPGGAGHVCQWVTVVVPATATTPEIHKHGCPVCGAYYED